MDGYSCSGNSLPIITRSSHVVVDRPDEKIAHSREHSFSSQQRQQSRSPNSPSSWRCRACDRNEIELADLVEFFFEAKPKKSVSSSATRKVKQRCAMRKGNSASGCKSIVHMRESKDTRWLLSKHQRELENHLAARRIHMQHPPLELGIIHDKCHCATKQKCVDLDTRVCFCSGTTRTEPSATTARDALRVT